MRTRANCFLTLVFLAVHPAANTQIVESQGETAYTIKFTSLPFVEERVVKGAPYSGREVELQFRTLADGSRLILYETERLVYRDSAGRFRRESPPTGLLIRQEPPGQFLLVRIDDPVSGYHYVLDPVNRVAHRFIPRRASSGPVPTGGTRFPSVPPPRILISARGTKVQTESLGVRTILGVAATGERRIQTNPEESQPFMPPEYVFETWTHEETGVILLRKTTGSRMGEQIVTVEDFRMGEADPALFRPPSDYKIQEETGPFDIVIPYKEASAQPTGTGDRTPQSAGALPAGGSAMPVLIHREEPDCTPEARAAKIQGVVILRIEIGPDGTPRVLKVVRPLDPGLDQKAIEAVSKWRFRPATRNGTPVSLETNVEVNFHRL